MRFFCRKTLYALRPESFSGLKVAIRKVQTFWASGRRTGTGRMRTWGKEGAAPAALGQEGCASEAGAAPYCPHPPPSAATFGSQINPFFDKFIGLGRGSDNQNGNLRRIFPLGVRPPPPQWT